MSRFELFGVLSAIYFAPNLLPEIANACGSVALIVALISAIADRPRSKK